MFKLATRPTYWWPIAARTPSADKPGTFDETPFDVQYRYLSVSEHTALLERAKAGDMADAALVPELIAGFRGVENESGGEVAYSAESLAQLLDVPGTAALIVTGYYESRAKAAEKN